MQVEKRLIPFLFCTIMLSLVTSSHSSTNSTPTPDSTVSPVRGKPWITGMDVFLSFLSAAGWYGYKKLQTPFISSLEKHPLNDKRLPLPIDPQSISSYMSPLLKDKTAWGGLAALAALAVGGNGLFIRYSDRLDSNLFKGASLLPMSALLYFLFSKMKKHKDVLRPLPIRLIKRFFPEDKEELQTMYQVFVRSQITPEMIYKALPLLLGLSSVGLHSTYHATNLANKGFNALYEKVSA